MSAAYIMGAYEHPTRKAEGISVAQLHMQSAAGALADAGLTFDDVDGDFCAGDAPGLGHERDRGGEEAATRRASARCRCWNT